MKGLECAQVAALQKAAESAISAGATLEDVLAILIAASNRFTREEMLRYVAREQPSDGVARGVRPPHVSKRRLNDPNQVTG